MEHRDSGEDLPVFVKWLEFLNWLIVAVDKFPKKIKFTVTDRMLNIALDTVELLVVARYSRNKVGSLRDVNLNLEKLRLLLRISYEHKFLSHAGYKQAMYHINEAGKMVGGWIKQQERI